MLQRQRIVGKQVKFLEAKEPTTKCRDPGSNRGPSDLRSDALPTELSRLVHFDCTQDSMSLGEGSKYTTRFCRTANILKETENDTQGFKSVLPYLALPLILSSLSPLMIYHPGTIIHTLPASQTYVFIACASIDSPVQILQNVYMPMPVHNFADASHRGPWCSINSPLQARPH